LALYLESLKILSGVAAKVGVEIWLENLSNYLHYRPFHYLFTNIKEFDFVLSQLDYPKFALDVGHANIGNEDPFESFMQFNKRLVAMSFSQNNGQKDDHLPLDKGPINYHRIVEMILEANWKGIIA